MSDPARTTITTTGMFRMMLPRVPGTISRGQNAAIVVRTAKMTGLLTCEAPCTADSKGASPFSRLRYMFSPMTIASSTTIPRISMNAKREIMLIDISNTGRSHSPVAKEMGIPIVTQKASLTLRKSERSITTRMRP